MCEYEYKWLVSKEVYNKLLNIFENIVPNKTQSTQINYYYDTNKYNFKNQNTTVRVRYKNGILLATVKKHIVGAESEETSWQLNDLPNTLVVDGITTHLLGEMMTLRTNFITDKEIIVSFDQNTYLGKTDYEIELEFSESSISEAFEWKEMIDLLLDVYPSNHNTNRSTRVSKSDRYIQEKIMCKDRKFELRKE